MWWKVLIVIIFASGVVVLIAVRYGVSRWESRTKDLLAQLETSRLNPPGGVYLSRALATLPAPVQRYFRSALKEGQHPVIAVSMEHTGTFNMSETAEQWKPFTAIQRAITSRPGFIWDATIMMMPWLPVRVHDAYVGGEGILHATLLGLIPLAHLRGTEDVARGELMRFLAEAAWYPTALLPGGGVTWEAVNDSSARVTLKDGDIAVALLVRFNESGLIASVRAENRGRTVNGEVIATPWEGRWWNYEMRSGMHVPLEGEVAWLLPGGPKPYWRGRVTRLAYEFSE